MSCRRWTRRGWTLGHQLGGCPDRGDCDRGSPAVAFTVAFLAMVALSRLQRRLRIHEDAKVFKGLQLLSAAAVSFRHGANDAQKTMGIMAAVLLAGGYITLRPDGSLQIDWWIPLLAYTAIAVGTVWGGWKIIETMGLRITTLRASSGLAANIGAVTAIFGATGMGIPISTTHASPLRSLVPESPPARASVCGWC